MGILILSGSRNPEGQTARAAQAFLAGVVEGGGQGEIIYLPQMKVERCRQCDENGWGGCIKEGRCVIDDDLAALTDKVNAADAVIFATPVYWSDLSESLKAFLDRYRRICCFEDSRKANNGRPVIGICVAGGGGGGAPTCALNLERTLQHCGFDVVDMVPARRQNLEMKLEVLKTTGRWCAANASKG